MEISARLAVILVNWRNAADTIECLETLLRSPVPLHIIVCDNDSADGSIDAILAWANGSDASRIRNPALADLATPPLSRPIALHHLKPGEAALDTNGPVSALTLIETGANLGYAGGNNVGLRFARLNPAITHFWLLNNDTVVDPNAAGAILDMFDTRPDLGMLGTQLRFYHRPDHFQMQGAMRFERWSGRSFGIGAGLSFAEALSPATVEQAADFICGASLVVSRAYLDTVGLLEERYFLYYEEIDWAVRNRGRFAIGYCPDAIVYHKEGASAGSSNEADQRSPLSDYHHARSKRIFATLHFPLLLPLYLGLSIVQAARRLIRKQPHKAGAMMRGWLGLPFFKKAASGK